MANTPFKQWVYPDEFEDPFYKKFAGLVGQIDAAMNALETLDRAIFGGGGTISWASGGGMGWTDDFVIPIFSSGFKILVRFGPDDESRIAVLQDGEVLYAEVPTALSQNVVVNMKSSSVTPRDNGIYTVAWRDGAHLRFRDGRVMTFA